MLSPNGAPQISGNSVTMSIFIEKKHRTPNPPSQLQRRGRHPTSNAELCKAAASAAADALQLFHNF
jgi:hypothetical protein